MQQDQRKGKKKKKTTQFFKLRFLLVSTSKMKLKPEYLHPLQKRASSASVLEAEKNYSHTSFSHRLDLCRSARRKSNAERDLAP